MKSKIQNKKKIFFIGFGDNLIRLIKKCLNNPMIDVMGVICRNDINDKLKNNFNKNIKKLNIKNYKIKKINSETVIKKLSLLNLDLICCWGYNELLNKNFINLAKKKVINLHPGLLPFGRGSGAINGEILNNSNYLGSTVHVINEKFDLGQIIGQIKTKFSGLEYYDEIIFKLKKNHVDFFYKSLVNYLFKNKKLKKITQFGRYYPKLAPYDDYIDWEKESNFIIKKVRSRSPNLLSKTIMTKTNKIIYVKELNFSKVKDYKFISGQIIDNCKIKGSLIKTADNALWIKKISYNGKNFFIPRFKIGTTFLSLNFSSILEYINQIKKINRKMYKK